MEYPDMRKNAIYCLLIFAVFISSCVKSPTEDLLQGTWIEQEGQNSKLVFRDDTLFFFHEPDIDSLSYSLDEKHAIMWTAPLDSSSGGHSYQVEWHKRKEILVVIGLFPSQIGSKSKNYFKKQ